ncbi:MAG TPA: M3 family oligoendopeptidase [Ruminococcaceae bacterium]|nr:M3 family oligoendopeptidase [Oscillospiraceae bacterium]
MRFDEMPYQRVEYDHYRADFEKALNELTAANSAKKQIEAAKNIFKLRDTFETMTSLCYIRHTVNTQDAFYSAENDYYDETNPKFEELNHRFYQALNDSPYRAELEKTWGSLLFTNISISLRSFDSKIMEDMAEENRLCTQYQKLIASAQIQFDGKILNLSQLGAYLESADRSIRKDALNKRSAFFRSHQEELDNLYDQLVHVRDRQAKALGFPHYVPLGYLRMTRNSYTRDQVAAFRQLVKTEIVPIANDLRRMQRARLGISTLYFYDEALFYPSGNPKPQGTPEEIFKHGQEMYHALSPETGEFFDFLLKNALFDALGRKGKASGGYCTELPDYKSPFIFANFNGTSDDISTLTHEAGHAFQAYLSKDNFPPEYRSPTLESCEIHSMSMEFFTWPWMDLFFGKEADRYRYMHLCSALLFLPYGCAVDEFQHIVYEHPEMSPKERRQAWLALEEVYLPGTDYDHDGFFSEGGRWQRQSHIYESPFYYIDYCLAQTCALEFWALMQEDRSSAWKRYLKLCKLGGKDTFTGLIKQVGLKTPFDPACLKTVAASAKHFLDQFDQNKLK